MKSLYNFLIESSRWTSTSTDKDYNWDNGEKNKTEKKKDYNIKIDDDPEWKEKVKKNIALYIVDSGRFTHNKIYLAIREKLINNILNKYTGSKVLYAVSATEEEGSINNKTTIKEISSVNELKNTAGLRPLMTKILSNIKENDSNDVDLNIVVSDESLLGRGFMEMKDFDKMLNDEIHNGLHMLIYSIKEYYYLDKHLEKFLTKDKFEIKVVERDKIYDYSKDKNK